MYFGTLASRRRRLFAEALESRLALSTCGVECGVDGGQLNIFGTPEADSIAVQFDASANMIRVYGGERELVGQYSLNAVSQVYVDGLAGNDHLEIDPHLPLALRVNGGEGEDTLVSGSAADHSAHGHEAVVVLQVEQLRTLSALAAPQPSAVTAPIASGDSRSQVLALTAHPLHPASALVGSSPEHGAHLIPATSGGAQALSPVSQHHLGTHPPESHLTHDPREPARQAALVDSADAPRPDETTHERHSVPAATGEVSTKVAPKRCTTTYIGRDLNRSVYGERQCDCEKKSAVAKKAVQSGEADVAAGKDESAADCLPCQAREGLFANNGALEFCMMGMEVTLEDVLEAREDPLMSESGGLPAESDSAEQEAGAADGLRVAGYAMLATGAMLLPLLWKRHKPSARDIETVMSLDVNWLAACRTCQAAA